MGERGRRLAVRSSFTVAPAVADSPAQDSEGATSDPASQESRASSTEPAARKPALKLSYEEYRQMANLFVIYMRRQEEQAAGPFRPPPQ